MDDTTSMLAAPPRTTKLRASCDACGRSKTRCDRNKPACGRCLSQGLPCVYGMSRKAGKPPRKRPVGFPPSLSFDTPSSVSSTSSAACNSHRPSLSASHLDPQDPMSYTTLDHMDLDSSLDNEQFDFATGYEAAHDWLALHGDMGSATLPTPMSSTFHSEHDAWLALDALYSAPAPPFSTPVVVPPPAPVAVAASVEDSRWTSATSCCTQRSKDIMRRLYCSDPFSPRADNPPARVLDLGSVLTRNRDVIASLQELLLCPCARTPHSAMLYASIISRVLLWYEKHVEANSNVTARSLSTCSSSSPLSSTIQPFLEMAQPQAPGMLPTSPEKSLQDPDLTTSNMPHVPVTVGSFRSENESLQAALTACLLVSELSTAGEVIKEFVMVGEGGVKVFQGGPACSMASESNAVVADAALFQSLGTWLRTEQMRIVRDAKGAASCLSATLGL